MSIAETFILYEQEAFSKAKWPLATDRHVTHHACLFLL